MRMIETNVKVILQDFPNHTSIQLCKYLDQVIETCMEEEETKSTWYTKETTTLLGTHSATIIQVFQSKL